MKVKRYVVNVKETNQNKNLRKFTNLEVSTFKSFNKGGIPFLVKSSKSLVIKNGIRKILTLLSQYYEKSTCNTKPNL